MLAAVVATSKEKKWMCGEEYIQGKHGFFPLVYSKLKKLRKYKSRIELEGRMRQKVVQREPLRL